MKTFEITRLAVRLSEKTSTAVVEISTELGGGLYESKQYTLVIDGEFQGPNDTNLRDVVRNTLTEAELL